MERGVGEDEVEVIEIGEGDIALLLAALKRLNNGIYALKVTLDFLSSRVGTLQDSISNLEKALKEHLSSFQEETKKHMEEERTFFEKLRGEVGSLPKDMKLSLDLFLEKLSGELEKSTELAKTFEEDVALLRSQMKEVQLVVSDVLTGVRGDIGGLKAKTTELEALTTELAQRVMRLEETMLASIKELRLAIQDISLQISALREEYRRLKPEASGRE
ncbi:MAG: hypothetical protein QW650_05040 [Thermofilum sp.]